MRVRAIVVLAVVGALGCNKTETAPSGISSSCSVTLSGAVSGTYNCQPATTLWSSSDNRGGFSFGVTASGTRPLISATVLWLNQPTVTSYTNADSAAEAQITVTTSANQTWQAAVGQGAAATGSYTLTFTSVVQNGANAGGMAYSADGTLNATLPAVTASGASGVVIITATF